MLMEIGLSSLLLKSAFEANESMKIDEKAMQKYGKAFAKSQDAAVRLQNKVEYMDRRLGNVANKKRAIINVSFPEFIRVYEKIQRIEIEQSSQKEDKQFLQTINDFSVRNSIQSIPPEALTDKQLICTWFFRGLGKTMIKDSERKLSAANQTMSATNIYVSSVENAEVLSDAIVGRADRLAKLLTGMNFLFINITKRADKLIQEKGYNVRNYADSEKGILMTLVNIADAISECIQIPVVDEEGKMYEAAVEMIQKNEEYLEKMKELAR